MLTSKYLRYLLAFVVIRFENLISKVDKKNKNYI